MGTAVGVSASPRRVVHLIDNLSSRGGAQQSIAALAPAIGRHGVHLSVAHLDRSDDLAAGLRTAGVEVVSLQGGGGRLVDLVRVARFLRAERPDLLHTSLHAANLVGRVAGRLTGVPVVTSFVSTKTDAGRADRTDWWGRTKGRSSLRLARRTILWVRRVHAVSPSVRVHVIEELHYPADRIDVVARGRDRTQLGERSADRREGVRAQLGLPADGTVLLAVGRHFSEKAYDVLLSAMPAVLDALPASYLLIAGSEGPESQALRAQCDRLGLTDRVHFLGHRDDLADLHSAADVFVLSSRLEGMPGALIEALAFGTPAVVTDIGPALDVVDQRSAIIVPVESASQLAEGIVSALTDADAAASRVAAGRELFDERFDIATVAAAMVAFYERSLVD
jgi:glycosyltransferase involved in cell wall biosynthesis